MKAIEIIQEAVDPKQFIRSRRFMGHVAEAIDPKQFLMQSRRGMGPVTLVKMANRLWPSLGWKHIGYGFEIQKGSKLYRVMIGKDGGGVISICDRRNPRAEWEHREDVKVSDMKYLLSHLKIFGLPIREALDPKRVMRQMHPGTPIPAIGELHRVLTIWGWQWEAVNGGPDGFWFKEIAPPNREWKRYELRLLAVGGAMVSIYQLNAENRWIGIERLHFDNKEDLFDHLRRLRLVLDSVLDLDPASGKLRYDPKRPKAPNSIWTYQRQDEFGNPDPYVRNVRLYSRKLMEIIIAYRKQKAPLDLLKQVKLYGPEVAKVATKAAVHIAWALKSRGQIDLVMPLPSSKPLARRFARILARQLGAELVDPITKTKEMKAIPILKRLGAARGSFAVEGRYSGKTILLVDDYIVTASSMIAAATALYKAGAGRVIGAALAV